jgi:hypothetical protein
LLRYPGYRLMDLGEYGALPFLQACLIANRLIAGPTFRAQLAAPSVVS